MWGNSGLQVINQNALILSDCRILFSTYVSKSMNTLKILRNIQFVKKLSLLFSLPCLSNKKLAVIFEKLFRKFAQQFFSFSFYKAPTFETSI